VAREKKKRKFSMHKGRGKKEDSREGGLSEMRGGREGTLSHNSRKKKGGEKGICSKRGGKKETREPIFLREGAALNIKGKKIFPPSPFSGEGGGREKK